MSKMQALAMLVFCVCTSVVVNAAVCDDLNGDGTTTDMHYSYSPTHGWRWWTRGDAEWTCHCNEGLQVYAEQFTPDDQSWSSRTWFRTCIECETGESTVSIYGKYTKKECNLFGGNCVYTGYVWDNDRLHSDAVMWGKVGYCYSCGKGNRRNMESKMNNPNRAEHGDDDNRQMRIYTNMGCERCLGGDYQASSSQDTCDTCTEGKYAAGRVEPDPNSLLSIAGHGNTRCDNCPNGKSSPAASHSSDYCSDCAAGKASAGGNPCTPCTAGKYSAARAAECSTCAAGQESAAQASTCTPCADNEANPSASGTCAPCSAGQYRESATQCTNCGTREISASGETSCTPCGVGEYATASNTMCAGCPAGKYGANPSSESDCVQCERGKYQDSVGQTECVHCARGTETLSGGADDINDCVNCQDGFVNPGPPLSGPISSIGIFSVVSNTAGICEQCVAGTYAYERIECFLCAPRYFSAAGDMQCTECKANEYSDAQRSDCIQCALGKIKEYPVSESDCEECGAGFYANAIDYECTQCPIGTKSTPPSHSVDDCEPCDPMYGGTPCTICPKGKYSSLSNGARTCVDCPAGTYGTGTGMITITNCFNCPATKPNSAPGSDAETDCEVCGPNLYFDNDAQECIHCKFPRALNSEALWDTSITDSGVYSCELCPSHAVPQFLPEQSPENAQVCDTILPLEADGTFVQQDTYISLVDTSKYVCNTGLCQTVPGRIVSRLVFDKGFFKYHRSLLGNGLQQNAISTKTELLIDGLSQNKYVFNIALALCRAPYFCDPKAAFDIDSTTNQASDSNFFGLPVFADKTDFEGNAFGTCAEGHVILQHAASVSTACIAIPSNMVIIEGINGNVGEYMESMNLHKNWYNNLAGKTLIWTPYVPGNSLFVQYDEAMAVPIAALPQESAQVACNAGYELSIAYDGTTSGVSTIEIGVDPALTCVSCAANHYSLGGATEAPATNPNAVAGYCKPCEQDCRVSTLGWSELLAHYDSTPSGYNLCPGEYAGPAQHLKSYDFLSSNECGWHSKIDENVHKYGCGADSAGYCGCPAGHFMQVTHTVDAQCTDARGIHNSANSDCSIQCVSCAAGSVGNALGFGETCTLCPAGQQPSSDQSVCEACPPGSYSARSGSVCSVCDFGPTDVIRASNTDPDLWDYSATGGTACERCDSGYYFDQTLNPRSCVACAPGTWKTYNAAEIDEIDATCAECTGCPAGKYIESCDATDGSVVCVTCDCAIGEYCVWDDSHQLTCQDCDDCLQGTERQQCGEFDAGVCTACPSGEFKDTNGPGNCSPCAPCPAMTRRVIKCEGSHPGTCELCPDGQYSSVQTEGCEPCTNCDAGTFDPCCAWGNGLHNDWHCGVDGSNSNVGCDACASPAPSTCQGCPANHYKTDSSHNYCDACAEAMAYGRHPACADFHELQDCGGESIGTCTQCDALQYFDACTNTCVDLPGDHKRVNITCTNSQKTVGTTTVMTVQCPCWLADNEENPDFATQVAVSCGQYAVQRDADSDDTAAGICHCIDGYAPFIPEDDEPASQCVGDECCERCGYHFYSANSQPCQPCPPGSGHFLLAQTDTRYCTCKTGFELQTPASETSAKICTACNRGFFKSDHGDDSCEPCEAGQYSDTTGADKCETCPANTYCTGEGNVVPSSCPPNTESPAGSTSADACQCVYPYVLKDDLALERQCVHRDDLCEENEYQTDATATCADFCEDSNKGDSSDDDCAAHLLDMRYALSLSHTFPDTADTSTAEAALLAAWRIEMLAVVKRLHNPNEGVGYGGRRHLDVMAYPVTTIDDQESYNFAIVFDRELYYGLCGVEDVPTDPITFASADTAQKIHIDILQLPLTSLEQVKNDIDDNHFYQTLYETEKNDGKTKLYNVELCTDYSTVVDCITPQDVCTDQDSDCADKAGDYAAYAYAIIPMHPDNTDLDNYVTQWTQANMHCCQLSITKELTVDQIFDPASSSPYDCELQTPNAAEIKLYYLQQGRNEHSIHAIAKDYPQDSHELFYLGGQGFSPWIGGSERSNIQPAHLYYHGPGISYPGSQNLRMQSEYTMRRRPFLGTAVKQTLPWHREPALFGKAFVDGALGYTMTRTIPIANANLADISTAKNSIFGTMDGAKCTDSKSYEWAADGVSSECDEDVNVDRQPVHACICSIKKCINSKNTVWLPNMYVKRSRMISWYYFMTPLVDESSDNPFGTHHHRHMTRLHDIGDLVQIHGYVLEVKNTMCEQEVIHERIYVPLGNRELLDRVAETSKQCADIQFGAPFLPSTTYSFSQIGGIDAKSIYYARIATVGKSVQVRMRTWTSYGFSKPSAWHVLRDDQRSCSPCPPHSTNSDRSATDVTACECDAGYTHILAPEYACVECASGKYKPTSGTDDCMECNPGDNLYWASTTPRTGPETCVLTDPLLTSRQLEPGFLHGAARVEPLVVCLNYAAAYREALLSPGRLIENQCVAINVCSGSSVRFDPATNTYSTPLPLATDAWHHRSLAALQLSHEGQETVTAPHTTPSTFTVTGSNESPEKILLMDTTFVLTVGQQVVVNWAATAADGHPFGLSTAQNTYTAVPDNIATEMADDANTQTTITLHSTDTRLYYMCRNGHGFSGVAVQMFAAPTVHSSHHNHYHVEYARIPAGVVLETAAPDLDLHRRTRTWQPMTSSARRVTGTCDFALLQVAQQVVSGGSTSPHTHDYDLACEHCDTNFPDFTELSEHLYQSPSVDDQAECQTKCDAEVNCVVYSYGYNEFVVGGISCRLWHTFDDTDATAADDAIAHYDFWRKPSTSSSTDAPTDVTTCTQNIEHNDPVPAGELGTTQMLRFSLREGYACSADGISPGTRLQRLQHTAEQTDQEAQTGEEARVPALVVACPQGNQPNGVYGTGCDLTCNDGFRKDDNDQCVSICSVAEFPFSLKCDGTDKATAECGSDTHKRYECQKCPPKDRFILLHFNTEDALNCQYEECVGGYISSAQNTCIPCPAHTRQEHNACIACVVTAGEHQPNTGQVQCQGCLFHAWDDTVHTYNCDAGTYALTQLAHITAYTAEHASALALPYSTEGTQDNAHHVELMRMWCAQGYACLPCVPGTAADTGGRATCDQCALGTYQNNYGSSSCVHCAGAGSGPSQTTLQTGATTHQDCVCSDGHGVPPV